MIKLATFTDERMTISASKLVESAMQHGVDSYSLWTDRDLPGWFKNHHKELLQQERGYGFYCWKPLIVSQEVNQLQDGDIFIWADAGQTLVHSVHHIINTMDSDIFLFSNGWPALDWTKMDCWKTIIGNYVTRDPQVQASLMFFRVSDASRKFVREWLGWSLIPGIINNEPSTEPNYPTFQEHRWDQSIIGCMAIRDRLTLHWFPTTTNYHQTDSKDKYPAISHHHRLRNHEQV